MVVSLWCAEVMQHGVACTTISSYRARPQPETICDKALNVCMFVTSASAAALEIDDVVAILGLSVLPDSHRWQKGCNHPHKLL